MAERGALDGIIIPGVQRSAEGDRLHDGSVEGEGGLERTDNGQDGRDARVPQDWRHGGHDPGCERPGCGCPAWLHVYLEDVDKTYELALQKGAESVQPPKDECFGDRMGAVKDSAGNTWWIATHKFLPKCQQQQQQEQEPCPEST